MRLLAFLFCTFVAVQAQSEPDSSFIFKSKVLPDDREFLPTVGNGHISWTIGQHNVYMNGLYNGERGESHRARIPNWANIRLEYCDNAIEECEYTMDAKNGIYTVHLTTPEFEVIHQLFPHRVFDRLIVNLIKVIRKQETETISIRLVQDAGTVRGYADDDDDVDIQFNATQEIVVKNQVVNADCGRTFQVEDFAYQKETRQVCVLWNHVPEEITLKLTEQTKSYKFIMAVDEQFQVAEEEMANALLLPDDILVSSHSQAWNKFWEEFDIKVVGNDELAAAVHASLFYLANSLPSPWTRQASGQYYGLSPSGLGRGGLLRDYQGHSFWDTETWMFPSLNLMDSKYSRELLSYRFNSLKAAMDNANNTGFEGARFPWESGYTGREVTPDCCPEVVEYQIHITADISYAMRLYFAVTHDYDWMKREGCQLSRQIAKFWASRATFNETTHHYELNGVMGPDEDHHDINNNPYTNVIAGYALYFGQFTECLCENLIPDYEKDPEIEKWVEVAAHLKLQYDAENDYHPQYDGYELGTPIKQADTILLGYPLEYAMESSTRENDLRIYENVTRADGPAMTWGMHAVNYIDIKDFGEAERLLNKSYIEYMRVPFKVWCEVSPQYVGAINFITGAGGFLQVIMNGYGGVRPKIGWLQLRRPQALPFSGSSLSIEGLQFMGSKYTIYANETVSKVTFTKINPDKVLKVIYENGDEAAIAENESFEIDTSVKIVPVTNDFFNCPLPKDTIGEELNAGMKKRGGM